MNALESEEIAFSASISVVRGEARKGVRDRVVARETTSGGGGDKDGERAFGIFQYTYAAARCPPFLSSIALLLSRIVSHNYGHEKK